MIKPFLVLQQVESEGPGVFTEPLEHFPGGVHYVRVYESPKVPETAGAFSGVLVLGGPMNVGEADRLPWLAAELRLIRSCRSLGVPLLGVCLGGQLLAGAFGGRVYAGPVKEVGWYTVTLSGEAAGDRLFGEFPREFKVFQLHGQTFDLPAGAVRLAGSTAYANQAFRLDPCLWGLQFHLEATPDQIRRWLAENGNLLAELPGVRPEDILEAVPGHVESCRKLALQIFDRLIQLALRGLPKD